jgi:hypothetical protein
VSRERSRIVTEVTNHSTTTSGVIPSGFTGRIAHQDAIKNREIAGLQILMVLVVIVSVLGGPFASFKFRGYSAFALANTNVQLVAAAIVLSTLGIAYCAYMWGWKDTSQERALRHAKMSRLLGLSQWIWVISLVVAVWGDIVYWATFTLDGYSWWVDAPTYIVILGAVVLTTTGIIAVRRTNHPA